MALGSWIALSSKKQHWRYVRQALAVGVTTGLLFAACSSPEQDSRFRATATGPSGAGGATSSTTTLFTATGPGGSINPTTSGTTTGAGGSGQPPLVMCNPPGMPCPMGQICVKAPMGMTGGVCSPNGGTCNPDMDTCQNDTYCCGAGCRLDGNNDPVCVIGGTRPTNSTCNTAAPPGGAFTPVLHCQWPPCRTPPPGDAGTDSGCVPVPPTTSPNKVQVLVTPLVADMPTKRDPLGLTASNIIIVTSDATTGAQQGDGTGGLIRILNGFTCAEEATIAGPPVRDAATPAIADLDGDGTMEIVTRENFPNNNKIVAFKWNGTAFAVMWEGTGAANTDPGAWDGVSIHDLNDDGKPEVIARYGEVYNGLTGVQLSAGGGPVILESDPVLGDVDGDGKIELIANQVFTWSGTGWTMKYPGLNATTRAQAVSFYAFADFGTRNMDGSFDHTKKDGIAEVVATGAHLDPTRAINEQSGFVGIFTLQGEALLRIEQPVGPTCRTGLATGERGGPPTIGNFTGNTNGIPQLATAGAYAYRVYDLSCKDAGAGCQDANNFVRWSQPSQDCSSGATGSTIFDFEGDGKAEAIYADECFVRVYDGKTGEVLFSQAHSTATWWEQNIIADTDHSDRSKLIFSNASTASVYSNCNKGTPDRMPPLTTDNRFNGMVDGIFKGLRCATNEDCPSRNCSAGFCRCTVQTAGAPDIECGNTYNPPMLGEYNDAESGFICTAPLPGTPGSGNVCRMQHGNISVKGVADKYFSGIRVYKDKLDRWASSRPMWNQHAYSITNINDNGTIPKTSAWAQNFKDPKLNNYRQNRQGATSSDLADITGALNPANACQLVPNPNKPGTFGVKFEGRICNRGLRGVGAKMPATFYLGPPGMLGAPICGPVLTNGPVPAGPDCQAITCTADLASVPPGATITMIVNDAGGGTPGSNRIVDECNYVNNTSTVVIEKCVDPPK